MKTSNSKSFSKLILSILVFFILVCMLAQPAKFLAKGLDGLSAWAFNVLPSVLPFMFFTKVLSNLDTLPALTRPLSPISVKLFRTPPISIYAFCMAILSGYPVGSKMVADLYLQGKITKEDAFKMSSFCSTSGPMFIIGAVGIGMFKSAQIGYILFISHALGAIINGIVFRKFSIKNNTKEKNTIVVSNNNDLSDIVLSSTLAILSVGCIITVFFIVIECFTPLLSFLPAPLQFFSEGLIEITKGCLDLSLLQNKFLATLLCSFVISFGGISTLLQSLTMLAKVKMPVSLFAFQKILHASFSAIITFILLLIFGV